MTNGTNAVFPDPNWPIYAREYCGLEAIVTNPITGVTLKLNIVDAFAHEWVKEPGSIDIMIRQFEILFGKQTMNHTDVIKGITWKLTGKRAIKYSFEGPGDP
ncbi:hypothetical protein HK096_006402 [Nowakowskiella sp. JEL0078]|nr:hypothetical protein HK096_006402 [Nowakowskiella sp. JEL0078]